MLELLSPLRVGIAVAQLRAVVEGHSSSINATLVDERVINKFPVVVDDAQRQHVERCKATDRGCPFIASSDQAIQSA